MSELQDAIIRIDAAQLGGESLDDEPEYRAVVLVTNTARRVANPDYEAAARYRWDARFGDGTWDEHHGTQLGKYTRESFLNSAKRDVDAALGITTKDDG